MRGQNGQGGKVKSNMFTITGILLVVAGLVALVHPEIKMPAKREELKIGGMKVPVETRRIVAVPAVLGGLIIVCGGGLAFLGGRKS
jgi:hypothetical protein